MLAYDYPILGLFWTMMILFLWIAWIMLLFRVFADIFRSHDMGGFAKALWSIGIIIFPFLGVFIYLLANGQKMGQRDLDQAQKNEAAFRAYVQDAAASGSTADELSKLADLKTRGLINDTEFEAQKAKILA
jgi:Short C-terminal domain/Phospholipase_D-nuclease N-terminal